MKRAIYTLLSALLLSACSSKPYLDYDTGYVFDELHSYAIVPAGIDDDPLMGPRIATAIDTALRDKGMSAATGAADTVVSYRIWTEERLNNSQVSVGLGTGSRGRSGGVAVGGSVSQPIGGDTRLHHVLQIDISDGDSGKLVWRSRQARELSGDPSRRARDIQQMVQLLLDQFPPKP